MRSQSREEEPDDERPSGDNPHEDQRPSIEPRRLGSKVALHVGYLIANVIMIFALTVAGERKTLLAARDMTHSSEIGLYQE